MDDDDDVGSQMAIQDRQSELRIPSEHDRPLITTASVSSPLPQAAAPPEWASGAEPIKEMRLADWTNALGESESSVKRGDDDSPDLEPHGGPSRTLLLGRAGLSVPTQPQVPLFSASEPLGSYEAYFMHPLLLLLLLLVQPRVDAGFDRPPWPRLNLVWNGLRP
ncbi:hypothetical protein CH63R_13349 [Colletotrichum higginsianum IMI 349063]|uniref:Uncharacterized protein n=1 Tax=Colletotrichum higginsianum (strain IMI 349063) TaxID=759273 RepID=A0A1B7XWT3_COLHI|nr:hypothetical protein CH63R_13349 [Colletotrichum higginsianum IMI 349063]OBR04222.1 hypothetical protein CH63R_13349 [Colletotrichum higginsianum IMI 349063]